jgi:hypothetical protein
MPAMTSYPSERLTKFMMAARQSPQFGVRLLAELSPTARAEVVRRWSVSEAPPVMAAAPPVLARPGLKKCVPLAAPVGTSGLGAQLQAFARSIRRVG